MHLFCCPSNSAKDSAYIEAWFQDHQGRYIPLVAEREGEIIDWVALNPYSHRCAYNGVGDLSIYVEREARGQSVGSSLLNVLEKEARERAFRKIVLFTFPLTKRVKGCIRSWGIARLACLRNKALWMGIDRRNDYGEVTVKKKNKPNP